MSLSLTSHCRFISVEGGEGAGKTTVLRALQAELEAAGGDVVCTREPGGTPLAELIRGLMLDPRHEPATPEAELLLVFAARAQHVSGLIRPALERGAWVLCDRFTDSSYAYQGGGRGIAPELIETLERTVVGLRPALTLLLDVPVAQGRSRARRRDAAPDRIERERDGFFERVHRTFLERAQEDPQRFRVIDASREAAQVAADAANLLRDWVATTSAPGHE